MSQDWLGSFVPLGLSREGQSWVPIGAGVLYIDHPVLWLITARVVLQRAQDAGRPLSAYVSQDQGGTILDLTTGRRGTPLDWLIDEPSGLATCLFPVDPRWPLKAFPEARCGGFDQLTPAMQVLTVGAVYNQAEALGHPGPLPLVLTSSVARVEATRVILNAPLPPQNLGAPLLVPVSGESGGGVGLAGIVTAVATIPAEPGTPASSLRLAVTSPVLAALNLIRSDAGDAQRRFAIERSRPSSEGEACSP